MASDWPRVGYNSAIMERIANRHAPIRALFLDIDGTIIGETDTISPAVRQAIAAARAVGCEVVLCTGRARFTALPIAAQIPPPGYVITSNGGVITHLGSGATIARRLMDKSAARDVIQAIYAAGAQPYVYEDSPEDDAESNRVLYHPSRPPGAWASGPRYRPYPDLLDAPPFDPVSVSAFGPENIMRPLAIELRERFGDTCSIIGVGTHRNWGVEVYTAGVSKQAGLETVAARLDVPRESVMAIGDHINDLEMIRWAGIGVAVQNAIPEILEAADYVTASVYEDGVARAIERFILS